ncbi:hypothetical protein BT96DRAFT_1005458 [Gymnopus androsaceus JB14]|uniref:Uncharacterized protein n=1 Tax=Gymnopus androsaceus JB14 TaxID=1447944 RepID=A0A6A4GPH9_9AGAR|nr:hypothetical protein BT96DRAFT_1005458 [Gymnopus androsaceus JB14]
MPPINADAAIANSSALSPFHPHPLQMQKALFALKTWHFDREYCLARYPRDASGDLIPPLNILDHADLQCEHISPLRIFTDPDAPEQVYAVCAERRAFCVSDVYLRVCLLGDKAFSLSQSPPLLALKTWHLNGEYIACYPRDANGEPVSPLNILEYKDLQCEHIRPPRIFVDPNVPEQVYAVFPERRGGRCDYLICISDIHLRSSDSSNLLLGMTNLVYDMNFSSLHPTEALERTASRGILTFACVASFTSVVSFTFVASFTCAAYNILSRFGLPGKVRESDNLLHCPSFHPAMHRIRRLNSRLSLIREKAKLADDQAEQNLCCSFSKSDDEETVILKPRLPLAPASEPNVQSHRSFPPIHSDRNLKQSSLAIQPTATRVPTTNTSVSPSIAGDHTDNRDDEQPPLPASPVSEWYPSTSAEANLFLLGGKDNAWWKAEYAKRDAAFLREERARKACKRYYQKNCERGCERAKINYIKRKTKLAEGTDEECQAACSQKQDLRACYRRENRSVLAEKARQRQACQRQP